MSRLVLRSSADSQRQPVMCSQWEALLSRKIPGTAEFSKTGATILFYFISPEYNPAPAVKTNPTGKCQPQFWLDNQRAFQNKSQNAQPNQERTEEKHKSPAGII